MFYLTEATTLKPDLAAKAAKTYIFCKDDDMFPAETVNVMLQCKSAEIIKMPDMEPVSFAFFIGKMVGENKNTEFTATFSDSSLNALIKSISKSQAKPAARKRKAAPKAKQEKTPETEPKQDAVPFSGAMNMPESEPENTTTTKTAVPDAFVKILKECKVQTKYHKSVFKAVQDAGEVLSYEMRLRMNIPNNPDTPSIYEKTKDRFTELKKISG